MAFDDWDGAAPLYEGLVFGPNDTMFTVSPTWERIDTGIDGVTVARIAIRRGRQDEFARTEAGTMTVTLYDQAGAFDPSNTGGDYFGLFGRIPIAFSVRDPVADEWWSRFRGFTESFRYEPSPTQQMGIVTITCTDWAAYLSGFELAPGHGDYVNASANPSGFIVYAATDFQTRLEQLWEDASVPVGLSSAFTGNTDMLEGIYAPGETIWNAVEQAVEAEWPGIAQAFTDKYGWLVAHGRESRFDPVTVSATATHWDFNQWKCGDGAAFALDDERAQMRPPYAILADTAWIRNAALAYPKGMSRNLMATQARYEAGSIGTFGTCSWSAPNLIVEGNFNTGLTGAEECQLYEQYMLDNYSTLRNRVQQLTFRPLRPDDLRAEANWALISRVDISDQMNVRIDHAGGGGLNDDFYVEGISEEYSPLVKDLDTGYPNVTMTLDLSPKSYWAETPVFS